MVPGAMGCNCPTQGVNGHVESFSLLTKYLSNYLRTPSVQGDHAGCWVTEAVRGKINSLTASAGQMLWSWCATSNKWCLGPKPLLSIVFCTLGNNWSTDPSPGPIPIQNPIESAITRQGGLVTTPSATWNPILQWRKLRFREVIEAERGLEIKSASSESVLFSLRHGDKALSILNYSHASAFTSNPSSLSVQARLTEEGKVYDIY